MALHGCRKPDAINRRKKLEMCVFENLVREQIIKTQCTLNIVVTYIYKACDKLYNSVDLKKFICC